jgi:8-oxo-dGTP pyrophosphatase MutT (NUDIX family)
VTGAGEPAAWDAPGPPAHARRAPQASAPSHAPGPGQRPAPPRWLCDLAAAAAGMEVPPILRPPADGGRPSAVLLLFADGPDGSGDPDLLFIQRSQGLRQHPGQPAFPGGAIEDTDAGPVEAALRETAEEAGVDPGGVEVLCTLPELFIAHSGFRVVPVLAWWHSPGPVSAVDPREVAAVERIGLAELADPASRVTVRHPSGRTGPAFRVKGLLIWGFTAALVDRLLALSGREIPWNSDAVLELRDGNGPADLSPGTQDRPIP